MTDRLTEEQERELAKAPDQERLQHEIDETRAELGDTVDALAQKADVKARVSEKVEQRKAALRERQEDLKAMVKGARERAEERPLPAIAIALGVGLLIGRAIGRR